VIRSLLVALLLAATSHAETADLEPEPSAQIVGTTQTYAVVPGDMLFSIGARFGVEAAVLARDNGIERPERLQIGQILRVDARHVVPRWVGEVPRDGIVINVPQRMLFRIRDDAAVAHYPIGVGRPNWRTPVGEFTIARREMDKTWYVPLSIQQELRAEGKPAPAVVPPGADNPLGRHWLGLSGIACGIHGTIAPASIYRFRSHGCIRLHADDAEALFAQTPVGERVRSVYLPVLLATPPEGGVFLEVHRDVYERAGPPLATLERLAERHGLVDRIDWERAQDVVAEAAGVARAIHRAADTLDGAPGEPR
jgi:L,D-transpeptidase ErfK/SrfK